MHTNTIVISVGVGGNRVSYMPARWAKVGLNGAAQFFFLVLARGSGNRDQKDVLAGERAEWRRQRAKMERQRAILFKFSITSIKKFNYFFFDIVDT